MIDAGYSGVDDLRLDEHELTISEIFGPTFQGEGPHAGRRCAFLRLAGCHLHCRYCDTAYTWRYSDDWPHDFDPQVHDSAVESFTLSAQETLEKLLLLSTHHVVISGGEPMLQRQALERLVQVLRRKGVLVEIETAGTHGPFPVGHGVHYNVSPKLTSSGNSPQQCYRSDILAVYAREYARYCAFKFVITAPEDLTEVERTASETGMRPEQIWLMPEGVTAEAVTQRWVAEAALKHGYNFTTRLQILLWGNQRSI